MPCVSKFRKALIDYQVNDDIIQRIDDGYESLADNSKPKERAVYFERATKILDKECESSVVKKIFEENACAKTGMRLKRSLLFTKENGSLSLEEKLLLIKKIPNMGIGHLEDNDILIIDAIHYYYDGRYHCACPNFNKSKDIDVPYLYCNCCGGHFKFHYEIMLGVKLDLLEVVTSALKTKGESGCSFRYQIKK